MKAYLTRRLLLLLPTLIGILLINFVIIQVAPGGPVEQMVAKFSGLTDDMVQRASGSDSSDTGQIYRGAQGMDQAFIQELEAQYGLDKPLHKQFFLMLGNYLTFDFGESFYQDTPVIDLIIGALDVSIPLGLGTTFLVYLIAIPLGIKKAIRHGAAFDAWTSLIIIIAYAIPAFVIAILLIILFCGGNFLDWFPLRGANFDNWQELSLGKIITGYLWHMTLPVVALTLGGLASLTMLTKNSFLEEIGKQYVITAEAKGLNQNQVMYGHIFRNAMLIVIAGFPAAFIGIFFTGALLIEIIFSLEGLGLLGFEAAATRDYPVMFGTLYIMTLITLITNIISDIMYVVVDPRVHFGGHDA